MSEGTRRKILSGLRRRRGRVPAERAGSAFGGGFPAREKCDGCAAEDRVSAVEHGVGEDGQIFGGGEQAGVSGNADEGARVFVLQLALDYPVAEGAIVGGWRDRVFQGVCGIVRGGRHAKRNEDFALAERV